jgi:hypothetical protein
MLFWEPLTETKWDNIKMWSNWMYFSTSSRCVGCAIAQVVRCWLFTASEKKIISHKWNVRFMLDEVTVEHVLLSVSSVFPCKSSFHHCSIFVYHCLLRCGMALTRQHMSYPWSVMWEFISDPVFGWLQSEEDFFLNISCWKYEALVQLN